MTERSRDSASTRMAFGPFVADLRSGELSKDGELVPPQDLPIGQGFGSREDGVQIVPAEAGTRGRAPSTVTRMPIAAPRRPWRRTAAALIVTLVGGSAYRMISAKPAPVRVAVVLFDNNTGNGELDRFAQRLTDVTVAALTANRSLAVIGNAAVLRTTRPFRDVETIRQALGAEYVIVGEVQNPDGLLRVVTHLIRAKDQAHVWIKTTPAAHRRDLDIESDISQQVARAVSAQVGER
jgi:TolB-like protein